MRHSRFSIFFIDCHFLAVVWMTPDWRIDSPLFVLEYPIHHRAVLSGNVMRLEQGSNRSVCFIIFADLGAYGLLAGFINHSDKSDGFPVPASCPDKIEKAPPFE